jgi:hypothetical protein
MILQLLASASSVSSRKPAVGATSVMLTNWLCSPHPPVVLLQCHCCNAPYWIPLFLTLLIRPG